MVLLGLLLVLAVLAAGVWLLMTQPWAAKKDAPSGPTTSTTSTPDTPDADETTTPETTTAPPTAATETPKPEGSQPPKIVGCDAASVQVEAKTNADAYATGQKPELSIALKNISDVDCTMDVGSSTQKFTVTSGSDTWWTSTDCQTEPSSLIVTLKAGEEVVSATPVIWDRTRSSVDTCEEKNRPRAPGGGASYHVSVSIGGFDSVAPKQFLLN